MPESSVTGFLIALLGSLVVAFVFTAAVAPPDPVTQLLVVGALMAVAVPIAYYLGYRGGYEMLLGR